MQNSTSHTENISHSSYSYAERFLFSKFLSNVEGERGGDKICASEYEHTWIWICKICPFFLIFFIRLLHYQLQSLKWRRGEKKENSIMRVAEIYILQENLYFLIKAWKGLDSFL